MTISSQVLIIYWNKYCAVVKFGKWRPISAQAQTYRAPKRKQKPPRPKHKRTKGVVAKPNANVITAIHTKQKINAVTIRRIEMSRK